MLMEQYIVESICVSYSIIILKELVLGLTHVCTYVLFTQALPFSQWLIGLYFLILPGLK